MSLKQFIKDKLLTISLLLFGIVTIEIFLLAYPFGNFIKLYIPIVIFGVYGIGIAVEYFTKRNFYRNLSSALEELDEKYLITEIINTPSFLEGKILKNSLEQIDKSMVENVNRYKYMRRRL